MYAAGMWPLGYRSARERFIAAVRLQIFVQPYWSLSLTVEASHRARSGPGDSVCSQHMAEKRLKGSLPLDRCCRCRLTLQEICPGSLVSWKSSNRKSKGSCKINRFLSATGQWPRAIEALDSRSRPLSPCSRCYSTLESLYEPH